MHWGLGQWVLFEFFQSEDDLNIVEEILVVDSGVIVFKLVHLDELLEVILAEVDFHLAEDSSEFIAGNNAFPQVVEILEVVSHPQTVGLYTGLDGFQQDLRV